MSDPAYTAKLAAQAFDHAYKVCKREGHEINDVIYISVAMAKMADLVAEDCAAICDAYGMPDGTSESARILAAAIRSKFSVK